MTISRRILFAAVAALAAAASGQQAVAEAPDCKGHGTSVLFAETTADAARYAMEEEKLLFILHVSGHFEESDYT